MENVSKRVYEELRKHPLNIPQLYSILKIGESEIRDALGQLYEQDKIYIRPGMEFDQLIQRYEVVYEAQ